MLKSGFNVLCTDWAIQLSLSVIDKLNANLMTANK